MRGHLETILWGLFAGLVVSALAVPASAVEPIKIGFGMGLTGGLAPSGNACRPNCSGWRRRERWRAGSARRRTRSAS